MDIASVNILAAFVFGMLSFLSPCVLPPTSGYMSMMSGYSASDLAEGKATVGRMLGVTLLFVAGFTAVFVTLGATATSLGKTLLRNQGAITTIAGWVVVAFGLFIAVSAVWSPKLLNPFMRQRRLEVPPVPARGVGAAGDGCGLRLWLDAMHRSHTRRNPHRGWHPGDDRRRHVPPLRVLDGVGRSVRLRRSGDDPGLLGVRMVQAPLHCDHRDSGLTPRRIRCVDGHGLARESQRLIPEGSPEFLWNV